MVKTGGDVSVDRSQESIRSPSAVSTERHYRNNRKQINENRNGRRMEMRRTETVEQKRKRLDQRRMKRIAKKKEEQENKLAIIIQKSVGSATGSSTLLPRDAVRGIYKVVTKVENVRVTTHVHSFDASARSGGNVMGMWL